MRLVISQPLPQAFPTLDLDSVSHREVDGVVADPRRVDQVRPEPHARTRRHRGEEPNSFKR
jgi:hypothetical protein